VTPACFAFAVVALGRSRSRLVPILFTALMIVGGFYALAGRSDPWKRVEAQARERPALRVLQRFVLYPWSSYAR
jgi:hypothetical protein